MMLVRRKVIKGVQKHEINGCVTIRSHEIGMSIKFLLTLLILILTNEMVLSENIYRRQNKSHLAIEKFRIY